VQDGTAQLQVSRMLPHLQQLSCFVQRCEHTAVQIVEQLAALYSSCKDAPRVIDATGIHFQVQLHTQTHMLGGLLLCMISVHC
jgi:WASH complex subunit 7